MEEIDVSIIIPMRNIAANIGRIIESIAQDSAGIKTEIIAVDMGSGDNTVFNALSTLRKLGLNGYVVQSGSSFPGSALNAGISKATGKYITCMFPRKLYSGCLTDYYCVAEDTQADFVFGTPPTVNSNSKIFIEKLDSIELLEGLIYGTIAIDAASVLISNRFVMKNSIVFSENFEIGYTEKFIYDILIRAKKISRSKKIMIRNTEAEADKLPQEALGAVCFDKIEAMLALKNSMPVAHSQRERLIGLMNGEKIPSTVFSCVDSLMHDGYGFKAVKSALKTKHYEDLLTANKYTSFKNKRKILLWKTTPWLYKPE